MNPSNCDLYAYQVLHYLVTKHQYQIVTIKQQRQDIWLMNANHKQYPIIRLSAKSNADTLGNSEYLKNAHRAILDIIHREDKLLLINTSMDSSTIDNDFLTQVQLLPDTISDTRILEVFPDIQSAVHDVEDNKQEYVQLTQSLETQQRKTRKQNKMNFDIKQIPKVTGIIIAICIVYWLLISMLSIYIEDDVTAAILGGAYYKMNVVSMYEYWRFLTSGFMHIDILHLLMNMFALLNVGMVCEKIYSRKHYLMILLTSIVVGNLFVYIADVNTVGVGISGGIFGLLGAFIVCLFENGSIKHPMVRAKILNLLFINFLISMLPGVSLYAHVGGFISGVFMGFIFVKSERWKDMKKHVTICFAILTGAMAGYSTTINVVEPLYIKTDIKLVQTARGLGITWYADYMEDHYVQYYEREVFE